MTSLLPACGQLVRGRPPTFDMPTDYTIISAVEGESVAMSCVATSAESFEWRIADATGNLLQSTSDSQTEISAVRNDSNVYRCVARNGVATSISPATRLLVKYLDGFDENDESISYELTTSVGRSFILRRPRLLASSDLDVVFSWFKDDRQQITSSSSHYITHNGDLIVTEASRSDFGTYKVVASSEDLPEVVSKTYLVTDNGDDYTPEAFSIIYFRPKKLFIEKSSPKEEVFDCVTSTKENVGLTWFLDGIMLTGTEPGVFLKSANRRLVLTNPTSFTAGQHKVECKAQASMGRVQDKKFVDFTFIGKPVLKKLPSEISQHLHGEVNVKCAVKKGKFVPVKVRWFFNGVPMRMEQDRLAIKDIQNSDFGLYQCEVSNEAGSAMGDVWLKEGDHVPVLSSIDEEVAAENRVLFSAPVPSDLQHPSGSEGPFFIRKPDDVTVSSATENVTLECSASGVPPLTVAWSLNGNGLVSDGVKYEISPSGLTIYDLRSTDDGEYICEAKNSLGVVSAAATLRVSDKNLIEYGPADQKSLIGTNVEFSCKVNDQYARRAQLDWFLNDEKLQQNGNPALRISRNRKGSLIIRQVGPDNIGEYQCVVAADGRSESASATLRIIEKPAMPVRVRAELHNETTPAKVRVLWSEGFDGNEPIIKHAIEMRTIGPTSLWSDWFIVVDNIPREDGKPCCSAEIEDLRPSVTAEFRVIASNKHGPGKASLPSSNITMPQQPPSEAPRRVKSTASSAHSLIVQWDEPRDDQSTGDVLGYVVRYRLAGYSSLPWNEKNMTSKDVRNAIIRDLIPWREYEVQVAAYNKRGLGVFSESIEVSTAEAAPTQAPKGLRFVVLNSTAIEIDFLAPDQQRIPGVNLGYKLQFWKGEAGKTSSAYKELRLEPNRKELHVVVDDLEKFGHYNLTVLCYTKAGDGPRSRSVEVVTEEDVPGPVDDLNVVEVMYNGGVVAWSPPLHPNGVVTKYTIRHWMASMPEAKTKLEIDGSQTNITIDSLQPSTQYRVDVMASTRKGDGPIEETKFESGVPPELPGRPNSLSVADVTARSAVLHFSPGFDGHTAVRQWIVEAKVADGSVYQHIFNISAPRAQSITVLGLRPFTKYQFRLIAENVKGRGAPSEPSRTFETLQTNPESPSARLFAEPISATSISVFWTPLIASQWNGQPKGYLILYREVGDEDWREVRTSTLRASEYTLSDLRPFSLYELDVFAENFFGRSESSEAVQARTFESAPSGSPRNVRAESDSPRSALVRWDTVADISTNGEVLGYKVRIVPEKSASLDEDIKIVDVAGAATLTTKISNLRPFTSYQVFVSAYTIFGHGPENSSPTTFETGSDVPSAPEGFQCSFISENEVRLKWLPPSTPSGPIKSYVISYWKSVDSRSMAIDAPLLGNLLMFSATNLLPNTQYTFAIRAVNEKGESEETAADVVTTSTRVPVRNPPMPLRDEQLPHSSEAIAVRWDESNVGDDVEAPVRLVQVSYQKTNDEWVTVSKKFSFNRRKTVIKRLMPNTRYRFRIRYSGDFLESSWSAESDWMQTMPAAPLGSPISLQATPFDSTSVQLQWIVPHKTTWNADAIGYRVFYRIYPSNDTWQLEEIPPSAERPDEEHKILHSLISFRHYIIRMRAFNAEGDGPFSNPAIVYVGYSIPKKNISNLVAEPLSSTSVSVRWDPWKNEDNEATTSFKVRYVPVTSVLSPMSGEEEMMIVDTNNCTLKDLRKFMDYQISVSPYNRAGEGNMAQLRTKTLEDVPGRVGQLKFADVLLDSVRVTWDVPSQPNGNVSGYLVNYKGFRLQEELKNEDQKRTTKNSFHATGLTEGLTYHFVVWAETAAGRGDERTGNVTIGPSSEGPQAPSRPVVISGQTSVALQWKDMPDEDVTGHLLQAKRVSAAESAQGYISQRPKRSFIFAAEALPQKQRPTHTIGEWVTLRILDDEKDREHISYKELQPSSFYVFRVFARNNRGVGFASAESEQLFVPESIPEDPFYTSWWFMSIVAMGIFVCIVVLIALLCITGSASKYRREKRARSVDSLHLADGNFPSFQLKGDPSNMTRSRELPTRPGTTQSWLSDREPPAYGSVLSDRDHGSQNVVNMYGLATDVIPALPNAEAMQRLSALVGRDVGGGSGYVSSARGSDRGHGDYLTRSDYATRSDYGRVEYMKRTPRPPPLHQEEFNDSFDDEDEESVCGSTIRGDVPRRLSDPERTDDAIRHYSTAEECQNTWRRVRETDSARASVLPPSTSGRASSVDSSDSSAWPTHPAPNLANGFSSFV
ncbi:unnamed protein product [Caenorhabditis auriculariae]|uniref:Uncharacterized protein n=1 Tax=Caenorhabditis auriculariae TaxID=2777116 RepID=A0A8S1H799_9PELO|nr:unnamed protein product [Caenorhabditis auriculariae]